LTAQTQRYGVAHVNDPILAFFAVSDEEFASFQIQLIYPQGTNSADPQPTMPEQVETSQIATEEIFKISELKRNYCSRIKRLVVHLPSQNIMRLPSPTEALRLGGPQ
jgi:hypothetical protein